MKSIQLAHLINQNIVYLLFLKNGNQTYIGATNNLQKRLRQHNGEISGGAKYTSKFKDRWYVGAFISGFEDFKESLQFEWAFKHIMQSWGKVGRIKNLHKLCFKEQWTKNSPMFSERKITIYLSKEAMNLWSKNEINPSLVSISEFNFEG